ncbi:NAD(P)/FAD-dependent oxidoreductase [Paenibacillus sp. PR3]|uniref:NAD(P)/FAD-dependent oxidoreductase n=1 Tax=Paenibacillus terricola TaxID=2763503 RepID=A0ABR8MYQ0_9BACL|nr:FAD-dependent oxidoreductase [Paenibacillus terricola]MBD3919309.1 NAD(P)/FAD-dependent oxidoreductase [Paenibacillus terricola]
MTIPTTNFDIAIVGGGVAGLTAALYAAQAGKRTILIEKQERLGGRAMTNKKQGHYFNLGGHALFHGDALATFRDLKLSLKGGKPAIEAHGLWKGQISTMPVGVKSLLTTSLLTVKGKMEFAKWFTKLGKIQTDNYNHLSVREWVEGNVNDPMARHILYSLIRSSTYVMAPDLQAAGPVIQQLQRALNGVMYMDRGWASIIEEMRQRAAALGVQFIAKQKVVAIEHQEGRVQQIRCEDGTVIEANNVIAAIPPAAAYQLVPQAEATALRIWKEQAIEMTTATLDVALRKVPQQKINIVYGIDQTVFLSNHSQAAHLSDEGAQVISVIKYQGKEKDADQDLRDLEQLLDTVHPGWRNELAAKQFLPNMTVSHDFVHLQRQSKPGPVVPEITGLYVAGEWVSHGEMLVDAATASAKRAVAHILSHTETENKVIHEHRSIV